MWRVSHTCTCPCSLEHWCFSPPLLSIFSNKIVPFSTLFCFPFEFQHNWGFSLSLLLGYCSQVDTLFDSLTVQEHLLLFGQLKGAGTENGKEGWGSLVHVNFAPSRFLTSSPRACSREDLNACINATLSLLDIETFRHVLACQLSGGIKRKLCVGIALACDFHPNANATTFLFSGFLPLRPYCTITSNFNPLWIVVLYSPL